MAVTKSNTLLKFGVPVVVILLLFIVVFAIKGGNSSDGTKKEKSTVLYNLTEEEQKELGLADGDTSYDTLKTLLSTVKQTRKDVQKVRNDNEFLREENEDLKEKTNNVESQIRRAVLEKQEELETKFSNQLQKLEDALEQKMQQVKNAQDSYIPISNSNEPEHTQEMQWVNPSDVSMVDKDGNPLMPGSDGLNLFKALDKSPLGQASTKWHGKPNQYEDEVPPVPFYTIPRNSTLVGSVAMTALIGRIPIDGALTEPFPFKVVIGQENLMANGIELPDVQGAIVSGKASGDWTLSCVTGDVQNITFIFNDGRVQTLPDETSNSNNAKSIGWLSTNDGVPCIPGARKTNAAEFLSTQFLLSGAQAAAGAFAQSQMTTTNDAGKLSTALTGDAGKFALGQGLAGGLKSTTDWYAARYGQMFDAIYVPPGREIVVNITKSLNIDYDFKHRKVKYRNQRSSYSLD